MRRTLAVLLTALTLLQASASGIGLVLSGGGAKGIAHVGVIQALEENDIPIDFVTGTSMGAIVGSLYAMGYTPDEMMQLICSRAFGYWSTGTIDPALSFYFNKPPASPQMFSFSIGRADTTQAVPASLISPLPMNFEFMRLFAPYTAACDGDFSRLMVPFRCVASDAAAKHKVVLSHGDLGDCVRASMSFPGVFQPTEVDGMLLYDGGIYDNFPLDVMQADFAPDMMIGVDVSAGDDGPQTSILAQLENLIMAPEHADIPADRLVRLRLHLDQFSLLDFPKARQIYKIGYDFAMAHMDSIRARIPGRMPAVARRVRREAFKARVPYLRFDSAEVTGGNPQQNRYISHLFEQHKADTFGVDHARDAYYRAISTGRISDMHLKAVRTDSTGLFRLKSRVFLKRDLQAAVGGYITSASNSYLYLSAGISSLSFHGVDASVRGWLGQSYMAGVADVRLYTPTRMPMALEAEVVASRRNYYESAEAFFDNRLPVYVVEREFFGRVKYSIAAGRSGAFDFFGGAGKLTDSFYRDNSIGNYAYGRDRADYVLWQAGAQYHRSTLDAPNYPTSGFALSSRAMAVGGRYEHYSAVTQQTAQKGHPLWAQLEVAARNYFAPARHFSLGLEADIMLSTRHLLSNYNASITGAPSFEPTPSAANAFRASFRANSFIGAGIVPVYRYSDALSARIGAYGFLPLRKICEQPDTYRAYYGRWLRDPEFFGEAAIVYKLPFAAISGWLNYSTGRTAGWNVGLSLGVYLTAPRFLQL